jgi:hypothetical protein
VFYGRVDNEPRTWIEAKAITEISSDDQATLFDRPFASIFAGKAYTTWLNKHNLLYKKRPA